MSKYTTRFEDGWWTVGYCNPDWNEVSRHMSKYWAERVCDLLNADVIVA